MKNLTVYTWFERDRAHLELRNEDTDKTILEFWDEEVRDIIEDGFIDPKDFDGSMIAYAQYLNLI